MYPTDQGCSYLREASKGNPKDCARGKAEEGNFN